MRETFGDRAVSGRPTHSFRARMAVLAFSIISVICLLVPLSAQAQNFQFNTINVVGLERIERETVIAQARIATGQTVSVSTLNDAYQRLVNSGLFETVEFEPQGATLIIRVREWPIISQIRFEGNRRVDDEVLARVVQSEVRRVYSPATAAADAAQITEVYRTSGRFAAEVDARIIRRSDGIVDLVFDIREGDVVEIERLSFVGNRSYSDSRLRRVLETKQAGLLRTFVQTDTVLEDRLLLDRQLLADFYQSRGYIDFEVLNVSSELARERDAFFVTFTVREGQQYRIGNVTASSEVPGVDVGPYRNEIRLRSGVVYSPTVIETTVERMEQLATRQGELFVRVDPRFTRDERNQILDVEFVLVEGDRIFIERIDISGNATTLDHVIRRQFDIVEGDPLNAREIRAAAERIRALGYFSDVAVEAQQGSAGDQAVIAVEVEEAPTGSLSFGASFAVGEGVGLSASFSERNFLGRGQQLDLSVNTTRQSREFTFNFVEPALLGRDLEGGISLRYRVTRGAQGSGFDTITASASPSLSFPVSQFGRLGVRYTLLRDEIGSVSPGSSDILARETGQFLTSSVGLTYSFDNRGSPLNPTLGFRFRVSQEFAGLGGDRRFLRTTALATVERLVFSEEVTLRAEAEAGLLHMVSGDSRVTERFFLGDRLRGFQFGGVGPRDLNAPNQDALGGNRFAVVRLEAEFPLGLPEEYRLSGGAFVDIGTVWGLTDVAGGNTAAGTFGPVDDSIRWRASAGVSLFWDTPIGPLRFNFSRPLVRESYDRPQNFDVTIATQF